MFCILNVEKRKRRLLHKNPPYYSKKVVIPKTAVFERLTVFTYGNKTDFHAVREHIKSFSKSVVFANGVFIKPENGIFCFRSDELKARMLFNTLISILGRLKKRKRLKLVIADRTGAYSDLLERIVPLAGEITVKTENAARYRFATDDIYESYGAVVNITDFNGEPYDYDIFLSLCSGGSDAMCLKIKNGNRCALTLSAGGFSLPDELKKYKDESISDYSFASALFSLSGIKTLAALTFDSFILDSRVVSVDSILKMLDTQADF